MLKYELKKTIDCFDWDNLVQETYGKPYCFQQQSGCQSRGTRSINISADEGYIDYGNDDILFKINGDKMCVKFEKWLKTSPEDINKEHPETYPGQNDLWWDRNFYPDLDIIANDLCKKGLIEPGNYTINIDW